MRRVTPGSPKKNLRSVPGAVATGSIPKMDSSMMSVKFLSALRGSFFSLRSNPGLMHGAIVYRPSCGLVLGRLVGSLFAVVILLAPFASASAQTSDTPFPQATELQPGPPLTNQEFVQLLYQLPKHPETKDKLVDDIRKRGIAFPLTDGLRSLVATKSGNDAALQRTLAEADRRRTNPVVASLPPTTEGLELLAQTRKATLGATETMPDYLVKQQIIRSRALGQTRNWSVDDRLSVAVSYRQTAGEDYKLLSSNGMPATEGQGYGMKLGGTISTGE